MCAPFVCFSFKFTGLFCINDISHFDIITLDSGKQHFRASSSSSPFDSSVILAQSVDIVYVGLHIRILYAQQQFQHDAIFYLITKKNIQLSACTTAQVHFKHTQRLIPFTNYTYTEMVTCYGSKSTVRFTHLPPNTLLSECIARFKLKIL